MTTTPRVTAPLVRRTATGWERLVIGGLLADDAPRYEAWEPDQALLAKRMRQERSGETARLAHQEASDA